MIPLLIGAAASAYSAYKGSQNAKKQQKAQDAALDFEKQKWNDGATFRDAGRAMMGREVDPAVLNQMYADPGNPFAAGNSYQSPWKAQAASAPPPAAAAGPSMPSSGLFGSSQVSGQMAKLQAAIQARQAQQGGAMGGAMGGGMATHAEPDMDQQGGASDGDADNLAQSRAKLAAMSEMMVRPRRRSRGMR